MPLRTPAALPRAIWHLPITIFVLKLLASALAGAAITMVLWQDWKPASPAASIAKRFGEFPSDRAETRIYRNMRRSGETVDSELERGIPINFPLRVKTVRFTPPSQLTTALRDGNVLSGKALRYLIGASSHGLGRDDEVTEVSYNATKPVKNGISIAYCNLFDETNSGRYGPYLHSSDTASQYNEGQIDPRGPGWAKNLREQFERRRKQGFEYIELDNPDAYSLKDVIGAIELAAAYGLKVIAKNPKLVEGGAVTYVAHPNVYGIIVERGAGGPDEMDTLRRKAGKPNVPVWFVAFGSGRTWASNVASAAKRYRGMGVTYSSAGEYGNAIDILPPV
jgi:hypothetical protein